MSALKWTSEKPTAPGWYWYRPSEEEKVRHCNWQLNRFAEAGEFYGPGKLYVSWRVDGFSSDPLTYVLKGQFAGPIPEPIDHSAGGPIDSSKPFIVGNGDAERFYPDTKEDMSMSEKYARMIQAKSFTIDEIKRLFRIDENGKPTEPKE